MVTCLQRGANDLHMVQPGAVLGIFIWVGQSKGQANFGYANRSGVRGDHGDDPRRLGRPGTSLGRPRPTRPNS